MSSKGNILLIVLAAVLLQSCMMPFGMGAMHDGGSMHVNSDNFNLSLTSLNGNYSQTLALVNSESNGNSKFFIKTEDFNTGNVLHNYDAELNLYRIPFKGAALNEILNNNIMGERIPFVQLQSGKKYINYSLLGPGKYYIRVNIFSIDGKILKSPLLFSYKFDYNNKRVEKFSHNSNNFYGINYWIWGAAMIGIMVVVMTVGF